jgi:hypothetical protein
MSFINGLISLGQVDGKPSMTIGTIAGGALRRGLMAFGGSLLGKKIEAKAEATLHENVIPDEPGISRLKGFINLAVRGGDTKKSNGRKGSKKEAAYV